MLFSISAGVGFALMALNTDIGGIASATPLKFVMLPVLYAWAEGKSMNRNTG